MTELIFETNKPLKEFNTFGLPCEAQAYCRPENLEQLVSALQYAEEKACDYLVLGGGSNLLFRQSNFQGLILHLNIRSKSLIEEDNHFLIRCGASEPWQAFVEYTLQKGVVGFENLSLIPGTVGACPVQNVGAYGVEVSDFIESVECYDPKSKRLVVLNNSDCQFGYRDSVFKRSKSHYIILAVNFKVPKVMEFKLSYGDIEARARAKAETLGEALNATMISDVICEVRSEKLPDPAVLGNAGSFFKNPIVPEAHFTALKEQHPNLIGYPYNNAYKLAAGWLIDSLGFKGFSEQGGAAVHDKQALVLVNQTGSASAESLFSLVEMIQAKVNEVYQVKLEVEPRII